MADSLDTFNVMTHLTAKIFKLECSLLRSWKLFTVQVRKFIILNDNREF